MFNFLEEGTVCRVKRIMTREEIFPWLNLVNKINIETVGVYLYEMLHNDFSYLKTEEIHGKAIRVSKYILSISKNVLLEAT